MVPLPADSLQDINFRGDPCSSFHTVHQDIMFSVYFLFALIFSTVGTPFPASSHEFDDPGSISPNNAGLDVFGSDTLPNADTIPTFSLASSPDDSLFAGEPPGYSGWESLDDPTMSANLPSNLAISGVGADDNIFGITTIDDGLPGELFNVDGSDKSFDLATKPSTGAANSCVSEVIQSIGKRKRVACQNPETGINTDTDTQTESQVENKEQRPLDEETLRHISGLDQPGLLQRELCLESFEAVCCTGQDNLGLVQTGCSKCTSSS